MSIGKRIKDVRTAAGWSQSQLAERVKSLFPGVRLSQQSLALLESGQVETTGYAVQIAVALEANPVWLATGVGSPEAIDTSTLDTHTIKAIRALQRLPDALKVTALEILQTLGKQAQPTEKAAKAAAPRRRKRPAKAREDNNIVTLRAHKR
jgi:transcriptional regulator with XRE-family HTH domain